MQTSCVLTLEEDELRSVATKDCDICYGTGRDGYYITRAQVRIPVMCRCVQKRIVRALEEGI